MTEFVVSPGSRLMVGDDVFEAGQTVTLPDEQSAVHLAAGRVVSKAKAKEDAKADEPKTPAAPTAAADPTAKAAS